MPERRGRPMDKQAGRKLLGPCAIIFAAAKTGSWRLERPETDAGRCVRCGICARYCPVGTITVQKEGAAPVEIDWRYCKGCGICVNECPKKCMELVPERGEG